MRARNGTAAGTFEVTGIGGAYSGGLWPGRMTAVTLIVPPLDNFNSNNTSDILFRNSAGDTWFEAISNGAFSSWQHVGGSNSAYTVPLTVGPPALT